MKRHVYRLLLTALCLGILSDILFWKQGAGINLAIFILLLLLAGSWLLLSTGHSPAKKGIILLIPIIFFAVMCFYRKEPLSKFLAYSNCIVSLGILAVTYTGGYWMKYNILDYFVKAFYLIKDIVMQPVLFFINMEKKDQEDEEATPPVKVPFAAIFRGILLALPILLIFTWLLSSADLMFEQKLIDLQDDNLFIRSIRIFLCSYLVMGVFLHIAAQNKDTKLIGEEKPVIRKFLGFTEAAIVMGSISLLFLSFVTIQFQYFFGGNVNISENGFSYSVYARRGFSELIIIAAINLLLILGLSIITKRENRTQAIVFSALNCIIVIQVIIMLVSAFMRLELAIDWHGFSRLRLYPQVFMIWLGILLIAIVILEAYHRERFFTWTILLVCMGFSASINLVNVDARIVHHNVQRTLDGSHFNVTHLANLSLDALPALAEEFHNQTYSPSVHEGIGAAMVCYWYSQAYADAINIEWRSFHVSEMQARQVFNENQIELNRYKANIEGRIIRIQGPSGIMYECLGGMD